MYFSDSGSSWAVWERDVEDEELEDHEAEDELPDEADPEVNEENLPSVLYVTPMI